VINSDINRPYLVQMSGLCVSSYYYTITALPARKFISLLYTMLQTAVQSNNSYFQIYTRALSLSLSLPARAITTDCANKSKQIERERKCLTPTQSSLQGNESLNSRMARELGVPKNFCTLWKIRVTFMPY